MTRRSIVRVCAASCVAVLAALAAESAGAAAMDYAITYEGYLTDGGTAPTAAYDFRFTLYDSPTSGSPFGGAVTLPSVPVTAGLFSAELSWSGSPWQPAQQHWLQVEVRPGGTTGSYTVLPRQKLDPAPYADGVTLPLYQTLSGSSTMFFLYNGGSGAAAEFASQTGTYGLAGRTFSTASNAAGVRGEALGASGNNVGVAGIATTSPAGTGLVGTGTATGAYIQGTGSTSTGVYALGYSRGLVAQNLGTDSAIYATGQGQTYQHATVHIENTQPSAGMCEFVHNSSTFATSQFQNDGSGEILWLEHHGNGNYIVATSGSDWKFWVDNVGVTHTKVLEILGGSDLSERFDVRHDDRKVEPGMLVSIDPDHEGRLTLSRTAYDHGVAGVVSGAGGVKPGMLMAQHGSVADGEQPIALTGRVYCWVDADRGAVAPGDLLTTSDTPGCAMKVTDPTRAQGAVVGKAMGHLDHGRGLVLVLVGLQ